MAATYCDSSAIVKRYVVEVGSAWVRRMVARPVHNVLYTAALTEVEVHSALQRLVREGRLDTAQAQRLTQRMTQHYPTLPGHPDHPDGRDAGRYGPGAPCVTGL